MDVRDTIENALQVLRATRPEDRGQARQALAIAIDALEACAGAVDELERELGTVTEPELDTARELERLRAELAAARERAKGLEVELRSVQAELTAQLHLQAEDDRRRSQLERKVEDLDRLLLSDDAAFDRFMDRALEDDERGGQGGERRGERRGGRST